MVMNFRKKLEELYEEYNYDVPDLALGEFVDEVVLKNCPEIPALYRYSPTDYYNIRALEKDELFLSEIGKMNDVFEGLSTPVGNWVAEHLAEISDMAYVKSFTENQNDLKMWSHYADNYAGMCVRYKMKLDDDRADYADNDYLYHLFPVVYSDKKIPSDRFDQAAEKLEYTKWILKEKVCEDFSGWKDIMQFFLQKATDWADEKEWRILVTYSQMHLDCEQVDDEENFLLYPAIQHQNIEFPFATDVYLGPKAPKYVEEHILEICKNKKRKVNVYRMKLSETAYRLEEEKIE